MSGGREPSWWRCLLALLAPGPCSLCDGDLPATAVAGICPACWSALPCHPGRGCPRCDLPAADSISPAACPDCASSDSGAPERVVAALIYADGAVAVHRQLKFDGATALIAPLAARMAIAWQARGPFSPDLCVPVPSDRWRLSRGVIVPHRLARIVARKLGARLEPRALVKPVSTRRQTSLTRAQRRVALAGAFRARPQAIRGRSVLLIDDVATTGATVREAAGALARAGAGRVGALVLARTPAPGYR